MSLEALVVLLRSMSFDGRRHVDNNDGALCAKEEERRQSLANALYSSLVSPQDELRISLFLGVFFVRQVHFQNGGV